MTGCDGDPDNCKIFQSEPGIASPGGPAFDGDGDYIPNSFSTNYNDAVDVFGPNLVNAVINGNLTVNYEENNGKTFTAFRDFNEEIVFGFMYE